jgi:hypothetical protein
MDPGGLARGEFNTLLRFEWVGDRHNPNSPPGEPAQWRVDMLQSFDMGITWLGRRTIFSRDTDRQVRAVGIRNMDGVRIGGLVTSYDGTTFKTWFLWSDNEDPGAGYHERYRDWNKVEITSSLTHGPHFIFNNLVAGPTAGHYVMGSYGGRETKYIQTFDNGETWSDGLIRDYVGLPGNTPNPTEPALVYIPDTGWMAFIRIETSDFSSQNCYFTKSDDLETWSEWEDTGFMLGRNPVFAFLKNDLVHVISQIRGAPFPGPETDFDRNVLVKRSADSVPLYNGDISLGDATSQIMAVLPHKAIGMVQMYLDGETELFFAKSGDHIGSTQARAASQMVMIANVPLAAGSVVSNPRTQILDNNLFRYWDRGTSFVTMDAGPHATRWAAAPSGAQVSVERVTLPNYLCHSFPFRAQYGMRVNNIGFPNDFVGFRQRWILEDAKTIYQKFFSDGSWYIPMFGHGNPPPDGFRVTLFVNDQTVVFSADFPPVFVDGGAWCTEAVLFLHSLVELFPLPYISDVTSIELHFNNGATVSEYDMTIMGIGCSPTNARCGLSLEEPDKSRHDLYFLKYEGNAVFVEHGIVMSSTTAEFFIKHPNLINTPTLSMSAPSQWRVVAASNNYIPTDVVASHGAKQTKLTCTIAGATPGEIARLVSADAAAYLFLDTGY